MSQLTDFQYYLDHQDELVKYHNGKVLVIEDCVLLGEYDSEYEALTDTVRSGHAQGTFIIQRCSPGDMHTSVTLRSPRFRPVLDSMNSVVNNEETPMNPAEHPQESPGIAPSSPRIDISGSLTTSIGAGQTVVTTTWNTSTTKDAAEYHNEVIAKLTKKPK